MLDDKYDNNQRTRAERRHKDWAKAIRKRDIAKDVYSCLGDDGEYYNHLHQYSKNKIHCSCGMCRDKTNNKSPKKRKIHGNYAPSYNPSVNEQRQNMSMDAEEQSYYIPEEIEEIEETDG